MQQKFTNRLLSLFCVGPLPLGKDYFPKVQLICVTTL